MEKATVRAAMTFGGGIQPPPGNFTRKSQGNQDSDLMLLIPSDLLGELPISQTLSHARGQEGCLM